MFNAARLYSAIWPIILLNLVFYVLFWSYSKSRKQKMERKQAKQENLNNIEVENMSGHLLY